jgi:DNA-binding protein H-NS
MSAANADTTTFKLQINFEQWGSDHTYLQELTCALAGAKMGAIDFELMSLEELWSLHEKLAEMLAQRLTSEKAALEARLKRLDQTKVGPKIERNVSGRERRPYPVVIPKYRNPDDPCETWSGRGKQPRWLVALLRAGKDMEDFRIAAEAPSRQRI